MCWHLSCLLASILLRSRSPEIFVAQLQTQPALTFLEALLQHGVGRSPPGIAEAGGTRRQGQAYACNGQRPESNNFLIDGANNFNGIDGGFVLKPPVDAISEFRILTHNAN